MTAAPVDSSSQEAQRCHHAPCQKTAAEYHWPVVTAAPVDSCNFLGTTQEAQRQMTQEVAVGWSTKKMINAAVSAAKITSFNIIIITQCTHKDL